MSTPEERYEQFIKQIYEPVINKAYKILDAAGIIDEIVSNSFLYGYSVHDSKELEAAIEDACNEHYVLQAAVTPKPVMLDCWKIR